MSRKPLDLEPIKATLAGIDRAPWRVDDEEMNMYAMSPDGMVADRNSDDEGSLKTLIANATEELRLMREGMAHGKAWETLVARIRGAGRRAPMIQNLKFIVAARQNIPALIAEVEQLRREISDLKMNLDAERQHSVPSGM